MEKRITRKKRIGGRFFCVLCFAALAAFALFATCERPEPEPVALITLEDGPIPFSEVELNPMACGWNNILYDNQIILINDTQTFHSYVDCDCGFYPEINFDSSNVVLWSGWVGGGSYFNTAAIECVEGVIHIDLCFQEDLTCVASEPWIKAFLLPKVPENTPFSVEVHVATISGKVLHSNIVSEMSKGI